MLGRILRTIVAMATFVALAACSPLQALNSVTPSSTTPPSLNIAYGDDPRNRLDVFAPSGGGENAPVVVFFYGGSWVSGSRLNYSFVGQALAARGIVAVIADYRLYPQVRYPDFLKDSALAVRWTARHIHDYGGDPHKLFVMGHSAGAYNAAMLALDPRWLNAVGMQPKDLRGWIGLAGPYDFLPIDDADVKPVFFFPNSPPESQPINHVTANTPPALLMASENDTVVDPKRNNAGLAKRLRAVGVPVQELYFEHTGHGTLVGAIAGPLRFLAPVLPDVVAFVQSDARRNPEPAAPVQ